MDKRDVMQDLHAMIVHRLFGSRPWLADRETNNAVHQKLGRLGLRERVAGKEDTSRNTPLGNELQLDLVLVFIGQLVEWEMPAILEQYGLIDEIEESRIYDLLETCGDPEYLLRPIVRKAYRDHFHPSGLLV